jgi:hypothetical protein
VYFNHIKKYILKDNSFESCTDLALSILECLTSLTRKASNDEDDDEDDDDDDEQAAQCWSHCHLVSLESLVQEKEICAGQLDDDVLKSTPSSDLGNIHVT